MLSGHSRQKLSDSLKNFQEQKESKIKQLEKCVNSLEESADSIKQYSRRPNLRFYGIPESETDEDTGKRLLRKINGDLQRQPPILSEHLERSHRLELKVDSDGLPLKYPHKSSFSLKAVHQKLFTTPSTMFTQRANFNWDSLAAVLTRISLKFRF